MMQLTTKPNGFSFSTLAACAVAGLAWSGAVAAHAQTVLWEDTTSLQVEAVAWSPDGTTIAVGGTVINGNDPIELRDAATGALLGTLPSSPLGTFSLDYSADGAYLAAGGAFISNPDVPIGISDVFETGGGTSIANYPGSRVAFAVGTNSLATAGFGTARGVRVHSVPSGTRLLEAFTGETLSTVTISPDGETVALGTSRGVVVVVAVATGQVIATLSYDDPSTTRVSELAFSPDGAKLAAAGVRFGGVPVSAKVWRTSDYSLIHTLGTPERGFGALAFTPDSAVVAAAATTPNLARRISFWNAADGQLMDTIEASAPVDDIAFSPDGTRFVYGQVDGTIVVVDNPVHQGSTTEPGDLNCDGVVSAADIDPFVVAVTDPATYPVQFPDCDINNADINGDGLITAADIDPFVTLLVGGTATRTPAVASDGRESLGDDFDYEG
jgi:WD40 repeat protein